MKIPVKQFKGIFTVGDEIDQSPEYLQHSENVAIRNGMCYPEKIKFPSDKKLMIDNEDEPINVYYEDSFSLLTNPNNRLNETIRLENVSIRLAYGRTPISRQFMTYGYSFYYNQQSSDGNIKTYVEYEDVFIEAKDDGSYRFFIYTRGGTRDVNREETSTSKLDEHSTLFFINNVFIPTISYGIFNVAVEQDRIIFYNERNVLYGRYNYDNRFIITCLEDALTPTISFFPVTFDNNYVFPNNSSRSSSSSSFTYSSPPTRRRTWGSSREPVTSSATRNASSGPAKTFNDQQYFYNIDWCAIASDGMNEFFLDGGSLYDPAGVVITFLNRALIKVHMEKFNFERISFFVRKKTSSLSQGDYSLIEYFDIDSNSPHYVLRSIPAGKEYFGVIDMTGIFLSQILGYTHIPENVILPISSFTTYCNCGGVTFASKNNILYRCAIGAGNIQKLIFHTQNIIKLPISATIITIANINGNLGVFTDRGLVILGLQDMDGDVVLYTRDITTLIIQDRYDVAEFPDGVVVNTNSGVYAINGSEKRLISDTINNIAIENFPTSSVLVDTINNYIYLLIPASGIYRYSSIYSVWEYFPCTIWNFWQGSFFPYIACQQYPKESVKYGVLEFTSENVTGKICLPMMNFGDIKSLKKVTEILVEYDNNGERGFVEFNRNSIDGAENSFRYLKLTIEFTKKLYSINLSIEPAGEKRLSNNVILLSPYITV